MSPRERVAARFEAASAYRISIVCAPVGFGKSVALEHYLDAARVPHRRWSFAEDGSAAATLAHIERSVETGAEALAIDDLQVVQDEPDLMARLLGLIERTSSRTKWLLVTRSSVGLPIGTWLASGSCALLIEQRDLAFTLDEAVAAARHAGVDPGNELLDEIVRRTGGSPAAIGLVIQAATDGFDTVRIREAVRDAMYRLWQEQVYTGISEPLRDLLAVASALPQIRVDLLEGAGIKDALARLEAFRERTSMLSAQGDGRFTCPELFREFLTRQTELSGRDERRSAYARAGRALEESGDVEAALGAYVCAQAEADSRRVLGERGFDLLDRGRYDIAAKAIESLPEADKQRNPRILALRGALQSVAGNAVRAEALLRRSLSLSNGDKEQSSRATLRLALVLTNQGQTTESLLLPVAESTAESAVTKAQAWSLLAAQYAMAGDVSLAGSAMDHIDGVLIDIDEEQVQARVLQRLGVAAMYAGQTERALQALSHAASIGVEHSLFSLACRAYTNLSNLVLHAFDDVERQLHFAELASEMAARSGDPFDIETASLLLLDANLRLGRTDRAEVLYESVRYQREDQSRVFYLSPSRALRLAWEGKFADAHRLLAQTWQRLHHTIDRATSGAQCSLYLALDAKRDASILLTTQVRDLLDEVPITGLFVARSLAMARLCCAIAEGANGRLAHADRILRRAAIESADPVILLAMSIGEDLILRSRNRGSSDKKRLLAQLERLRALGYAHMALLMESAALAMESTGGRNKESPLTPTETEILSLLADGLSPQDISVRRKSSINTVRTHIARSIAKLRCSGTVEVLALARKMGLLN